MLYTGNEIKNHLRFFYLYIYRHAFLCFFFIFLLLSLITCTSVSRLTTLSLKALLLFTRSLFSYSSLVIRAFIKAMQSWPSKTVRSPLKLHIKQRNHTSVHLSKCESLSTLGTGSLQYSQSMSLNSHSSKWAARSSAHKKRKHPLFWHCFGRLSQHVTWSRMAVAGICLSQLKGQKKRVDSNWCR